MIIKRLLKTLWKTGEVYEKKAWQQKIVVTRFIYGINLDINIDIWIKKSTKVDKTIFHFTSI